MIGHSKRIKRGDLIVPRWMPDAPPRLVCEVKGGRVRMFEQVTGTYRTGPARAYVKVERP